MISRSRPRFWVYLFGPYLIGSMAGSQLFLRILQGSSYGIIDSLLSWGTILLHHHEMLMFTLYFLLPANLLIYGVNDIFDYETDKRNTKKQDYESLLVPNKQKKVWRHIFGYHLIFIAWLILKFWINPMDPVLTGSISISLALFMFFGIFYSAKPIRAKKIPFLDGFFNILYILPAFVGFYGFGGTIDSTNWFLLLAGTFWAAAMHCYSAIPDISADKDTGIQTTAVYLGPKKSLLYCALLRFGAAALSFGSIGLLAVLGVTIYIGMILLSYSYTSNGKNIFGLYRVFPYINTLLGFALFVWIILFV